MSSCKQVNTFHVRVTSLTSTYLLADIHQTHGQQNVKVDHANYTARLFGGVLEIAGRFEHVFGSVTGGMATLLVVVPRLAALELFDILHHFLVVR